MRYSTHVISVWSQSFLLTSSEPRVGGAQQPGRLQSAFGRHLESLPLLERGTIPDKILNTTDSLHHLAEKREAIFPGIVRSEHLLTKTFQLVFRCNESKIMFLEHSRQYV